MGRGRGKGGCECCEAVNAFACCLCLILVGGPILIAVGATILAAANKDARGRNIDAVKAAVDRWNDGSNPNGWQQFGRLAVQAALVPGTGAAPGCVAKTVALLPSSSPADVYDDEAGRFRGVTQLKHVYGESWSAFEACAYSVTFLQQLPSATEATLLAAMSEPVVNASAPQTYTVRLDEAYGPYSCTTMREVCWSWSARACEANCRSYGGSFDCSGGQFSCSLRTWPREAALKVSYRAAGPPGGTAAGYRPEDVSPGAGAGAGVMPKGFQRTFPTTATANTSPPTATASAVPLYGPLFQPANAVQRVAGGAADGPGAAGVGAGETFRLLVRSADDPWLAYMAVTGGSGQFGTRKRTLVVSGVILVLLGCLGTAMWAAAAYYAWRMLCARRRPTSRPPGVGGYAWDLANRYGGSYAPAIGVPVQQVATGPDGTPIYAAYPLPPAPSGPGAAPAMGQPVAGYPAYPPGPYGHQPYPYPYPPPGPYGPPGGTYEMANFGAASTGGTAGAAAATYVGQRGGAGAGAADGANGGDGRHRRLSREQHENLLQQQQASDAAPPAPYGYPPYQYPPYQPPYVPGAVSGGSGGEGSGEGAGRGPAAGPGGGASISAGGGTGGGTGGAGGSGWAGLGAQERK